MFSILEELDFKDSSCSVSRCIAPAKSTVWTEAKLDPYCTNKVFHMIKGILLFVEISLSTNNFVLLIMNSVYYYIDMRSDTDWKRYHLDYCTIVNKIITQILAYKIIISVFNSVLHNNQEYFNPESLFIQNIHWSIDSITVACNSKDVTLVRAKLSDIVAMLRAHSSEQAYVMLSHGMY